jgi:hypothetical protein
MASLACVLCLHGGASAVVAVKTGASVGNPASADQRGSSTGNTITRATGFVKYEDASTLTLTDGRQYSLSGVKVVRMGQSTDPKKKKIAEMVFINKELNEVIIHAH